MVLKKTDIKTFYDEIQKYPHLCKGCGLCAGICPQNAITMYKNEYQEYLPLLDFDPCIACGKCISGCIGKTIPPLNVYSPLGNYRTIYLGHSTDKIIRMRGSSGGVVTALISWGLKNGFFSQAMIIGYKNNSVKPLPIHTKDPDEVLCNYGSKYISYPLCDQWKKISEKTAVTVLPCHASALKHASKNTGFFLVFFAPKERPLSL